MYFGYTKITTIACLAPVHLISRVAVSISYLVIGHLRKCSTNRKMQFHNICRVQTIAICIFDNFYCLLKFYLFRTNFLLLKISLHKKHFDPIQFYIKIELYFLAIFQSTFNFLLLREIIY